MVDVDPRVTIFAIGGALLIGIGSLAFAWWKRSTWSRQRLVSYRITMICLMLSDIIATAGMSWRTTAGVVLFYVGSAGLLVTIVVLPWIIRDSPL
jgi:hypothetical protein